jgi:flagellar M-ring protein FliF
MNALMQTIRNLGAVRLAAVGAVTLGMIAFFIFLTSRLSSPDLALLFADLPPQEAGRIVSRLEQQGIRYQLRGNGGQIYVPSDQVLKLRVSFAEQGLPGSGNVGYELFDKGEPLGTANFQQNINALRAMEGELARTIMSINRVANARVHLVMPRRELFSRDRQQPSASVVLKMKGAGRLEKSQVQAIQHLISTAVPDLDPNRISIVDDRGTLLAKGGTGGDTSAAAASNAEEMKIAYEQRVARAVEQLLENTVGPGRVRTEVNADLDFSRVTENSETYNPEGQVIRSTQTVEEKAQSSEADSQQSVTVQNNLPEGTTAGGGGGSKSVNNTQRNEETVNYEISRVVRNMVRETGQVRRISVAVLVDGMYSLDADRNRVYAPRPPEQLQQLEALVRSAIGFRQDRGDLVQVVNMQFAPLDDPTLVADASTLFGLSKADFLQLAEVIVLGVVGLLVLLLVVRPVVARLFEAMPGGAAAILSGQAMLPGQQPGQPALAGPGGAVDFGPVTAPEEEAEEALDSMIDIGRVEGRVRASSLKKIGEIVDKHPEEAVAIVRNWMYQES